MKCLPSGQIILDVYERSYNSKRLLELLATRRTILPAGTIMVTRANNKVRSGLFAFQLLGDIAVGDLIGNPSNPIYVEPGSAVPLSAFAKKLEIPKIVTMLNGSFPTTDEIDFYERQKSV